MAAAAAARRATAAATSWFPSQNRPSGAGTHVVASKNPLREARDEVDGDRLARGLVVSMSGVLSRRSKALRKPASATAVDAAAEREAEAALQARLVSAAIGRKRLVVLLTALLYFFGLVMIT